MNVLEFTENGLKMGCMNLLQAIQFRSSVHIFAGAMQSKSLFNVLYAEWIINHCCNCEADCKIKQELAERNKKGVISEVSLRKRGLLKSKAVEQNPVSPELVEELKKNKAGINSTCPLNKTQKQNETTIEAGSIDEIQPRVMVSTWPLAFCNQSVKIVENTTIDKLVEDKERICSLMRSLGADMDGDLLFLREFDSNLVLIHSLKLYVNVVIKYFHDET